MRVSQKFGEVSTDQFGRTLEEDLKKAIMNNKIQLEVISSSGTVDGDCEKENNLGTKIQRLKFDFGQGFKASF